MAISTLLLFFVPVLFIGGIFLQIFLSRRESKWFGFILPAITLFYSLLMVLSVAIYDGMGSMEIFILIGSIVLICNIPTIIFLGIYFGCREKMKARRQIDKMNIQDLE